MDDKLTYDYDHIKDQPNREVDPSIKLHSNVNQEHNTTSNNVNEDLNQVQEVPSLTMATLPITSVAPPLSDYLPKKSTRELKEESKGILDPDLYFSYNTDQEQLISSSEIYSIFKDVCEIFGFQKDNFDNVYELFMSQLDSKSSRVSAAKALMLLHSEYIGGEHANYRKWYFCAMLDEDPELLNGTESIFKNKKQKKNSMLDVNFHASKKSDIVENNWRKRMYDLTAQDLVYQIALYLMIWGEANNMRFVPELLCFIYKCAIDHLNFIKQHSLNIKYPKNDYLNRIITPLYNYYRDQQYKLYDGEYVRSEKDHAQIIGYDDMNQLFWYYQGIEKLKNSENDKSKFVDISKENRYDKIHKILWKDSFHKTYRERRSWWHLSTNFSRIWIIHLNVFWYYSSFNSPTLYTLNYSYLLDNQPTLQSRFSIVALGSTVGCIIQLLSTIFEFNYIPYGWPGRPNLWKRLIILILLTIVNFIPSVFVLGYVPLDAVSQTGFIVSIVQFIISILTTIGLAFHAPFNLFDFSFTQTKIYDSMKVFTASFPSLGKSRRAISVILWILVFGAKFLESYFFLTLSLRDPIRNLHLIDLSRCYGDYFIRNLLCKYQNIFVLGLMFLTDLILFFLDTYLWYIIWNCVISLSLSFSSGISMLSPWRNIFTRLPSRIYSKLLATSKMEVKYDSTLLVSQIWNAFIISLYREHFLSQDHVQKMIYSIVPDEIDGGIALKAPSFFLYKDDNGHDITDFFVPNSEAERRISFFAQSLSTSIPEAVPVETMPQFTVFIPHYSEKILLELKEIIKQDSNSKMSLLEYLKVMYIDEWKNFVADTKIMVLSQTSKDIADGITGETTSNITSASESTGVKTEQDFVDNKINDLPLYCIGYKSSAPEYIMRTKIWASLRTQTLYRTVSGFMNYSKAIKLLHKVENPEMESYFNDSKIFEDYLDILATRKFRMLVSMQRLQAFNDRELANLRVMITTYPTILISSLNTELDPETNEMKYFSVLYTVEEKVNENSPIKEINELKEKFRIQLSGNPILGDGKSDNQNLSVIYYRGEIIQVIDANQDNYLEECMKIRSVLAEFENLDDSPDYPYIPSARYTNKNPVAILGAREYIFSENSGVLGDVAASKEQTFGTMFARTLSEIGGKLHYGHPDFLNGIFMNTRGGISKAQKGLHLNEDIYAGMNAICRGGKIKHCDYYQCGKGRDLGFSSILNFTTKIGGGMGEQLLSREYYYIGTQMSLDRFLSFYYAHPGFHINNLFIMLSLEIFMLTVVNLGALNYELIPCIYDKNSPITDLKIPIGCQNLQPILDWVYRYVLSIFICFFISFIPLVLHELSERGLWKASRRLFMHFLSLSPIFEVFVCQIYTDSLKKDIIFGGARYISTGRGFSISRVSFTKLYSAYAPTSIYAGARLFLLLLFATITMWQPSILWFWITLISLTLSPFLFNPHEFSRTDFFLDYREFIRWLSRGNSKWHFNSWITYTRLTRSKFTGFKKIKFKNGSIKEKIIENNKKAPFLNTLFAEVIAPFLQTFFIIIAYLFMNSQSGVENPEEVNLIFRLIIVTIFPILLNTLILLFIFPLSLFAGPLLSLCCNKISSILAAIAHFGGVIVHVITFELVWVLEGFNFSRALILFISSIFLQRSLFQCCKLILLSREMKEDLSNRAWWSGKWILLGKYAFTQPLREFVVKINEMSLFSADFFIGHGILILLTPLLIVPYIDHWHSCMIMWINPMRKLRQPIFTVSNERRRKREASKYAVLYFCTLLFFAIILIAPIIVSMQFEKTFTDMLPSETYGLIQPNHQNNNDTGERAPSTVLRKTPTEKKFTTFWI
jgi:1,3-beta-glucan synthase